MDERGKLLLLNAYKKTPPKKSVIQAFIYRIFHSKDDEFIEEVSRACRGSSYRLLKYVERRPQMPTFVDQAITNIILLILCDDSGGAAKKHAVKKKFHIFSAIGREALKKKDFNTAWLIDSALKSAVLNRVEFRRSKSYRKFLEDVESEIGRQDNLYKLHIIKAIDAYENDVDPWIPCAAIFDMQASKARTYEKELKKKKGSRKSWYFAAERANSMVKEIIDFSKITFGQQTQLPLIKLYTRAPKRSSHRELFELSSCVQ